MRESIGGSYLFQIVLVLILLFTAYLCLSINYTAAYKVSDSIVNQIKLDEGVNMDHIITTLSEASYKSAGKCNDGKKETGWTAFDIKGNNMYDSNTEKAALCLKKIRVSSTTGEHPDIFYYKVKVFYKINVPIISSFNFNVQSDTPNIYSPNDNSIKLEAVNEVSR